MADSILNIVLQDCYDLVAANLIILVANISGDCETRRNRYTKQIHLSKVSSLATKQVTHLGISLSLSVSELVNSFFAHKLIEYVVLFMSCDTIGPFSFSGCKGTHLLFKDVFLCVLFSLFE